ncbi:unnamed protein product [Urochloa decumbens]|uniref:Uncharacterized protein n=1 Tax=Urochloa decumbens TaxID=240449 RepID=A0ABC9GCZ0_9POAL
MSKPGGATRGKGSGPHGVAKAWQPAGYQPDETPLYFATQGGSQAVVNYLLGCGADPNKASNSGITPLHHAARRGYCEIAGYLLFKGANVDPICQDGEAPLHVAALYGHAKMVKLLSDHNANLNRLSRDLLTPLAFSLFGSSSDCFHTLIQEGANINNTHSPVNLLSVAAHKGLADCTTCLLNYNADPNEPNEDGKLPLEIAASKRWRECFEILFPVTNPLPKYANLTVDQIIQQEVTVRLFEEYMAIGEGDFAFWEKKYTHALGCYSLALKLGHKDTSLYAKMSICHLHKRDLSRYLDDALAYMDAMDPDCSEEDAKKSVLGGASVKRGGRIAIA